MNFHIVSGYSATGVLGGGAGGEGSPGIILGLPVLLRHTGILCHKDAGEKGGPRIILGLPVLLQRSGMLRHRGAGE